MPLSKISVDPIHQLPELSQSLVSDLHYILLRSHLSLFQTENYRPSQPLTKGSTTPCNVTPLESHPAASPGNVVKKINTILTAPSHGSLQRKQSLPTKAFRWELVY